MQVQWHTHKIEYAHCIAGIRLIANTLHSISYSTIASTLQNFTEPPQCDVYSDFNQEGIMQIRNPYAHTPKMPSAMTIQTIIRLRPLTVQLHHIKGHQDTKSDHPLMIPEKLNIDCDTQA